MFLFNRSGINGAIKEYESTPGAILLDVREEDEYRSGHIPGARNIPLSTIEIASLPDDKSASLFVYCLSGARSRRAVNYLKSKGFRYVKNIGGINSYRGTLEK